MVLFYAPPELPFFTKTEASPVESIVVRSEDEAMVSSGSSGSTVPEKEKR